MHNQITDVRRPQVVLPHEPIVLPRVHVDESTGVDAVDVVKLKIAAPNMHMNVKEVRKIEMRTMREVVRFEYIHFGTCCWIRVRSDRRDAFCRR